MKKYQAEIKPEEFDYMKESYRDYYPLPKLGVKYFIENNKYCGYDVNCLLLEKHIDFGPDEPDLLNRRFNPNDFIITEVTDELPKETSMVEHPNHYQSSKMEVIEVIDAFDLNFNLGNVVKYVLRCGKKDNPVQELEKAKKYLEFEIKKLKETKND